jgi:hypothetical protein
MARRTRPDPLGRLRYVPLAMSPIGIATIVVLILNIHDRPILAVCCVVIMAWAIAGVIVGLALARRWRTGAEKRS